MTIRFFYRIGNIDGTCSGSSVSQAIDRAKVDYLRKVENVTPSSSNFRLKKGKLAGTVVAVYLPSLCLERYKFLYRAFKDGDCSPTEVTELKSLQTILNDERLKWN